MEKIIILGFGGHAKSLVEIIEQQGRYEIQGFVTPKGNEQEHYRKYSVIAPDEELDKLFACGITNAVIGVGFLGNAKIRDDLYILLKKIGYHLPVIVDQTAIIAEDVSIGEGSVIGKGCIINSDCTIGKMTIINTGAVIEHECCVGDFSHISVSSVLCGSVKVGRHTFIGANASVKQCVNIGDNSIIGMGSIVIGDVEDNSIRMGVVK